MSSTDDITERVSADPLAPGELPVGLPMPRRIDVVFDPSRRVRARTVSNRFPYPLPNGWFIVAAEGEIAPGTVKALHYFSQDLVAWAGESGEVFLADAYCPHQGAHLAVGGRVEGDEIRCPFHGWRFEGTTGVCTEIPYARTERIPPKACLRHYPTLVRNGYVWAWHHLEGGDPFFDVPVVPEFADTEGWLPPITKEFTVATTCQEMAENNHDFAHFKFVHGTETIPEGEEIIDGTYKATKNPGLERETFGLGLGIVRVPGVVTFLSSVTPIDEENVHVRWTFTSPVGLGVEMQEKVAEGFALGVSQDLEIWENKIFRSRPVLVKGEGGILAHRRWAAQFYSVPVELPDEI